MSIRDDVMASCSHVRGQMERGVRRGRGAVRGGAFTYLGARLQMGRGKGGR